MALSLAEKDPDTFAYFEEHHPELAAWLQRATWLTKYKNMTEIDWSEAQDYTQDTLYPVQDSRRKVGVAVGLALATSAVLGGIGYKIQSERNAIAVAQKALEEKMNAIRLRVTQTKEMPENTIQEMEAKLAACADASLFIERQSNGTDLDVTAEKTELGRYKSEAEQKLARMLLQEIESHILEFNIRDNAVNEEYFGRYKGYIDRIREIHGVNMQPQLAAKLEKYAELCNQNGLAVTFLRKADAYLRILKSERANYEEQYEDLIRSSNLLFKQLAKNSTSNPPISNVIEADMILQSNADARHVTFLNSLAKREYPQNFRLVCEYFVRTNAITSHSYNQDRLLNLENETEYLAANWITYKAGEIMFEKPQTMDNETGVFLHEYIKSIIQYLKLVSECSEFRDNSGLASVKSKLERVIMHTCYAYVALNPAMNSR